MRKFQLLKKKQPTTTTTTTKNKSRVSKSSTPTTVLSPNEALAGFNFPELIEDDDSFLAPEILPGLVKSTSSSDQDDGFAVPIEVTVIEELLLDRAANKERNDSGESARKVSEVEVQEYLQQIKDIQKLVDQRTMDLNRSRQQVAELIKHNSRLLQELKATTGKGDASLEDHRMIKQELNVLKFCFFIGALWIWFGGRADVIGIVAFVWILADASSY